MKKFTNYVVLILVMVMVAGLVPLNVSAQSIKPTKAPYSDVTKKKVGTKAYEAIAYLKKHGAFRDVVKGKNFYPNKVVTRQEFILMLGNLYGDEIIPVTAKDIRCKVTSTNVEGHRLVKLTRVLGKPKSWPISRTTPKFTRALAARMIYEFTQSDPAFKPRH